MIDLPAGGSVTITLQLHEPEELRLILAGRVRELRLAAGWKQSSLADRAGVSLPTLRRFERTGKTSLENFLRICHALGQLDRLASVLEPPAAVSLDELDARTNRPTPQRGRR